MENLELKQGKGNESPFLDIAIYISLLYLELSLYENNVCGYPAKRPN